MRDLAICDCEHRERARARGREARVDRWSMFNSDLAGDFNIIDSIQIKSLHAAAISWDTFTLEKMAGTPSFTESHINSLLTFMSTFSWQEEGHQRNNDS